MDQEILDKLAIREVIDGWIIWSDSGDWERFKTVWHPGAVMSATWFQAPAEDFMRARREGWERGVSIIHFQGGTTVELKGNRAIAQTKMIISQRAKVHEVLCDVNCMGRFYDFFEKRDGRWAICRRQPIYEKDWITSVDSQQTIKLDPKILESYPEGYRHLAYLQAGIGYNVGRDRPGLKGPIVEALYERGKNWLEGGPAI